MLDRKFKPAALALALATAFASTQSLGQVNPSGGVAVHGQASFSTPTPTLLNVVTQNGAGTNHSAINWQSFSIAAGNSTNFQQPNATSMAINRVVTNNPSVIFGSLSSNGKLVLVNQSGIAIGAGAIVDTAGFTASALRMSDADALAGRLRFGEANASMGAAGGISVDGRITARNGDVVLVAPSIELGASALVQAPNGSTLLAAGQQVEITGRGLEGIKMLVQAPGDSVRNLGTLQGNAVGIFAGTLRHSGEIQATTASLEGGTVFLKASGDAYVEGAGKILATGTVGGHVDVLGKRVAVADQAVVDVSGTHGGGTIRIGGDYQGKNAQVQNAQMTYVGADTVLNANAVDSGAGGKVIVWADDVTRAYGNITANAGSAGGGGGFVETSGHRYLDVNGIRVTASGSATQPGSWLLDPSNVTITHAAAPGALGNMTQQQVVFGSVTQNFFTPVDSAATSTLTDANLNQFINAGSNLNVTLTTTNPSISGGSSGDITFDGASNGAIVIDRTNNANTNSNSLTLNADRNIVFASGSTTFQRSGASTGKSLTVELNPGTSAAGKVLTNSGASVVLNGVNDDLIATVKNGKVWQNSGTVTLNGRSLISLPNETSYATFANLGGGVLNVNSSNPWSFLSDSSTQGGILNNAGTLNVNGTFAGNSSSWEALYSNLAGGTLNIGAGKFLSMQNAGTLGGSVFIDTGGSLKLSEQHGGARTFSNTAFSGFGALTIGSGVAATFATTSGSVEQLSIDGTASVNGALSVKDYSQTLGGSSLGGSGALTITRNFTHTAGTFAPTGNVAITKASGSFSFNETVNAASLALSAPTGGLALNGSATTSGTLSLNANGPITQGAGAIIAAGATTVNAGASGNVTLTNPANNFSSIGVTGGVIQLRDANALVLNAVNAQTSLTVTTAGNVTQSAPIIVSGTTTVNAGSGNVTLTTPGNNLNSLSVSGNAVNIVNGSSSTLAVNSLSSGSNQAVSLTSGAGLTLPGTAINTGTANLTLSSGIGPLIVPAALSGTNISLAGAGGLTINAGVNASGTFSATTTDPASVMAVNRVVTSGGAMNLNLAGGLVLQSGTGSDASLTAVGNQTIAAKYVEVNAAGSDFSDITTTAGNQSITTSGKNVSGEGVLVKNTGSGQALFETTGSGSQTITANNADFVRVLGLVGDAALNSSGNQTIIVQGTGQNAIQVGNAAASGKSSIFGSNQSITAGQAGQLGAIQLRGGVTDGNDAHIVNFSGSQTIVTTGALTAIGGTASGISGSPVDCSNVVGSCAAISQGGAALQSITAGSIGLQAGSSGGYNIAAIFAPGAGASQSITITGGGTLALTGGSGGGTNNRALIATGGAGQTIAFSAGGALQITGGTVGASHSAQVSASASSGTQTISGATSISLAGGGSGGGSGTGNSAALLGSGSQNVTVGSGGLNLTAGGGSLTDNTAQVNQLGTSGTNQTITVNGGGSIVLQGGSSALTNVGAGHGSAAFVKAGGDSQLIEFSAPGGSINANGGTVGSNNIASIQANAIGTTQTIHGTTLANAPTITLTGGASGGATTEGNQADIFSNATQQITARATTLQSNSTGNSSGSFINAPIQTLVFNGDLSLIGGSNGDTNEFVRIGGKSNSDTSLNLSVTGNLTLAAGSSSGVRIGANGSATGHNTAVTINTTGDVVLNPSATQVVSIGSSFAAPQTGSISVTAGGNIALNSGGGTGAAIIRSLGNVSLSASGSGKSISEAPDGFIRANQLSATSNSGITLDSQSNQVTSFGATNTATGDIKFTNAPGTLLAVTGITETGGNVRISADDLDISGAVNAGSGTVTLRPTSLARNINIESSPSAGVMSLSPSDLQQVTALNLDVGRLDGSGNVNLNTFLGSGNVNGGTLRLLAGNNVNSSAGADIGSGASPFNHNLELRANNDVQLTNGNVSLGLNRSLTVLADIDSSGVGNVNIGAVTLQAGSSVDNTAGNMSISGQNITAAVSGGGSGLLRVTGSGTQTFTAANNIGFSNANAASGNLVIRTDGGLQTVSAAGTFTLAAGTGTGTSSFMNSGGNQSITTAGVTLAAGTAGGGSGTGNFAIVKSAGTQTITVGTGGLTLTGGGGALTDNTAQIFQAGTTGTSQIITVNAGGSIVLQGGSSAQTNVGGSGHGSRALIEADGDSQQITFAAGGAINLTGGTNGSRAFAEIYAKNGSQTISGAPAISLAGGASGGFAGEGNTAGIYADGGLQTISASALALIGGATGIDNRAEIAGQLAQNIVVTNAPSVSILARAGKAGLFAAGNQTLSISGAASANALTIGDAATSEVSFVTGNNQQVTVGTGGQSGSITIRGGSAAGKNSGIFSNSGTQTVSTTGTLSLSGGTAIGTGQTCNPANSGSCADISNSGTGLQTVSANTIQIQGGSGGVSNGAGIFVNGGPMQINAGAGGLHLIGGSGTSDNFASIGGSGSNGQTLTLNVAGNSTLDASNNTVGSSAFIGLGGTGDLGTVTINFNGAGDLTLTGSNTNATTGSAIGVGGNQTNATAVVNIGAANVTLNPGTQAGVRIGHATASPGPGDISVTASGNIALNSNGSVGSAIRTNGNVTLQANSAGKSISSGANSGVGANTLTASANAGINLPGSNVVGTLNASSGGGNIAFSNTQSLTVGTISTPAGAQNISLTAVGGGSGLSLGATTSDDNWTLVSGGSTALGGAFNANSLSLTSGAALTLSQDIGVTGNLSLITPNGNTITQSGGTVTVGGQTTVNAVGGDVTLTRVTNDFNQFAATGGIVRVRDANSLVLNTINAQALAAQTGGSITLNGPITASAPGDAVALAATAGTLDASAGSITTPSGRWLLYLPAPGGHNFGPLVPAFKQYGTTLGSSILGTGNGLLYGSGPSITAALAGAVNKTYDGLTGATLLAGNYSATGSDGDVLTLNNPAAGNYDTKDVGAGKTITVNGVAVTGASNGGATVFGYSSEPFSLNGSVGSITPKALTASAAAPNKVYDGNTTAAPTLAIVSGLVGSETVTATGSGSFNSKNVLTANTVTVNSTLLANGTNGGRASNYNLASGQTIAASITPKTLTATATATSKVYDGSAAATTPMVIGSGLVGSETVGATGTGSFNSKNVLAANLVTVTSTTLSNGGSGGVGSNYVLAAGQTAAGNITPRPLTAAYAGADKVYDGSPSASVTAGSPDLVGGDAVSFSQTAAFTDRNAGSKTINVSTISLSGADASNYVLANTIATTRANITPLALSTWNGSAGSNWFDAANWNGSALPDGNNVVAVRIPPGPGNVDFGSTAGLSTAIRSLTSERPVIQSAPGGTIVSSQLTLDTKAGIALNNPLNRIGVLNASNQGSGNIAINNTGALELQALANTVGNITVTNTGAITTTGVITAPAGAVSITANSPLTVGTGGIAAGGDITLRAGNTLSPGVTDNLTLNGPVSSQGKVSLSAGNNLFQNSAIFGLNGVSATAGGNMLFGPLATANKIPVSYTINGVTINPPPTEVGGGSQTSTQVSVLLTFLDQFEKALTDQLGQSPTNPDGSRKRKSDAGLVTDAEVCK